MNNLLYWTIFVGPGDVQIGEILLYFKLDLILKKQSYSHTRAMKFSDNLLYSLTMSFYWFN